MRGLLSGRFFGRSQANDSHGSRSAISHDKLENLRIRWLIRSDTPDVLRIEQASFSDPWSEEEFCTVLCEQNRIAMVAVRTEKSGGDRPIGYMVYQFDPRMLIVLSLAVHPLFRGQGVGSRLIGRLKDKLHPQRRRVLISHVWERNLAAQLFFRAEGFMCRAIERDAYDNGDAAYVFSWRIS